MNAVFNLDMVSLTTYKLSTAFLSMIKLKSPEFDKYKKSIYDKIKKEFNINIKDDVLKQNVQTLKNSNVNEFKYMPLIGKIINQIINVLKIYISEVKINFKSDDNILP